MKVYLGLSFNCVCMSSVNPIWNRWRGWGDAARCCMKRMWEVQLARWSGTNTESICKKFTFSLVHSGNQPRLCEEESRWKGERGRQITTDSREIQGTVWGRCRRPDFNHTLHAVCGHELPFSGPQIPINTVQQTIILRAISALTHPRVCDKGQKEEPGKTNAEQCLGRALEEHEQKSGPAWDFRRKERPVSWRESGLAFHV